MNFYIIKNIYKLTTVLGLLHIFGPNIYLL